MPLQTDLSISPYFDDWSAEKDYYKILFRPGVSVQARELNQLQTILQSQIERFGDNIFKRGTIIDGCDISFHSDFPYVKITDKESDGAPVNVLSYDGYSIKNSANLVPLVATVTDVISGYESQSPDLNTLYVRYQNSGYANVAGIKTEQTVFAANQTLTLYDPINVIEKVRVVDGSSGFSNSDSVVVLSAIAIQNSTGGTSFANNFYAGDFINNGTAQGYVYGVDTTSNTEVVILKLKPRTQDLHAANSALWNFAVNTSVQSTNATPSDIATIVGLVGTGAKATIETGTLGNIVSVNVNTKGSGYYITPYVSVASKVATTGQITSANLVTQNWLANVVVANTAVAPIGSGYAMTVGQGVVYQKGYFSRVDEQLVVVSKYSTTPDAVSVGFDTTESVINSNQDETLLDNATGSPNFTAPGANRLKLTPTLVVKSKAEADANTDFLSIAEFSAGYPYKQNRQTVYNVIGNEMAQRTYEESGNYVLDTFSLNTKAPVAFSDESTKFDILIDPGKAYIEGNRVETDFNYETGVQKGTDTVVATNATISLNYGNYIRVNELGGPFRFSTGATLDLYSNAGSFISGGAASTPATTSLGTNLGSAKMRTVVLESGVAGTSNAVYRIYLFDINLNVGVNFASVRSVFYNGTNKSVADLVLENGKAVVKENNNSSMLYFAGNPAVKNVNNISYVYRTHANNLTLGTNGIITWTVSGGETFPYTGVLNDTQERDIIIVPLANAQYSANIAGSLQLLANTTQVTGTSTSFSTVLETGDFIKVANSSASVICQVNNIANDTILFLKNTPTSISGNAVVYLPGNVPIALSRAGRFANVSVSGDTFVVGMGNTVNVATTVAVAYNVRSSNTTPVSKTVNRDRFVRLNLSNNAVKAVGPWPLGVTDVFRMKGVYKGANTSFAPGDAGVVDVTSNFYIDHNQTEDYYGISYLYMDPNNTTAISNSDVLLVKFDHFTDSGTGLKAPGASGTYLIDDTKLLANSTSTINTMEIPEVFGTKGAYYDLRDQFDFRPQAANTVTANTVAASAPINPTEPVLANKFSSVDKKFPAPNSTLTGTVEYYVGRTSRVTVDRSGSFTVMHGIPGSNTAPVAPSDALTINLLNIPPYPSLPYQLSSEMIKFVDTKIANEKYTTKRLNTYRVTTPLDPTAQYNLQPRGYTMQDIGSLERRIAALEYYTSFTLTEILTQKKSIPSSFDPSVERYKFGFFVESFDDYSFSDISNPAYKASVVNGDLVPYTQELNLTAENNNAHSMLPFVESKFIGQPNATNGINTGGSSTGTTASQVTAAVRQNQKTYSTSDYGTVYEDFFYVMSDTAGPVGFYMSHLGNETAFEFSQASSSSGPYTVTQSSASAASITTNDAYTLGLWQLNDGVIYYIDGGGGQWHRYGSSPYGGYIYDQYKVNFTYNPANGKYVRVRIIKANKHGKKGTPGAYEFKMYYPIDATVDETNTTSTKLFNYNYEGIIKYDDVLTPSYTGRYSFGLFPYYVNLSNPAIFANKETSFNLTDQKLTLTVSGLRPGSTHTVKLNNIDVSSLVKPEGSLIGSPVITDSDGTVTVEFYYGNLTSATSQVEKATLSALQNAATKNLTLTSSDSLSYASTNLRIPQYVSDVINNQNTTNARNSMIRKQED